MHACVQAVEGTCKTVSTAAAECAGSLRGEAELRDRTGVDLAGSRRPMCAIRAEKEERTRCGQLPGSCHPACCLKPHMCCTGHTACALSAGCLLE
jgi:hypothetical protein